MTEILTDAFIQGESFNRQVPTRYGQIINRVKELKRQTDFGGIVDLTKESYLVQVGVQAWQKAYENYMEYIRDNPDG